MLAGLRAAGDNTPVYGVSVRFDSDRQGENIHKQFVACAALFEAEAPKSDVVIVDSYVGPGYSLPTDEMREAIELFAKKEGIFLDPVYTGKGAAGLIGLAVLTVGGTIAHSTYGLVADRTLTVIGSIVLAVTHYRNFRLSRHAARSAA